MPHFKAPEELTSLTDFWKRLRPLHAWGTETTEKGLGFECFESQGQNPSVRMPYKCAFMAVVIRIPGGPEEELQVARRHLRKSCHAEVADVYTDAQQPSLHPGVARGVSFCRMLCNFSLLCALWL